MFLTFEAFKSIKHLIKVSLKQTKLEIFGVFVIFSPNLSHFPNANCCYFFKKASWTINCFLLKVFIFLRHHVYQKCDKKAFKSFQKSVVIGIFVNFALNLRHFSVENCVYSFRKDSSSTNSLLENRKFDKTFIKTLKIEQFCSFCHFCSF